MLANMVDRQLNYGRAALEGFFASFPPVESALDIGVGRGDDLLALRRAHSGARLYGVDFVASNLQHAAALGIEPLELNVEHDRIPRSDASVDVVIANQVFEHLKEVFWSLHECCRVLADNGHLVIGVPNLASFHNRLLLLAGRQPTCIKTVGAHVRGFTKADVLHLVRTVSGGSLSLVGFRGANFYPFPASIAPLVAKAFPGGAVGMFFAFRKVHPYRPDFLEKLKAQPFETNFYTGEPACEPESQ